MTVAEIIKAVRLCIDEQASNNSDFINASDGDNIRMDDIIKSRIGDSMRWVCLNGTADVLSGKETTSASTGVLKDFTPSSVDTINVSRDGQTVEIGKRFTLPSDFVKIARVRVSGWHRAVIDPLAEDSDEYLQLYDNMTAYATADRPQAAIINSADTALEVFPGGDTSSIKCTYVADPTFGETYDSSSSESTVVNVPSKAKTSFIYYLAFLVLTAYDDPRAARFFEIAKMNTGRNS